MQEHAGTIRPEIHIDKAIATPREGMSLDELIIKMEEIGNKVIKVNRKDNTLELEVSNG